MSTSCIVLNPDAKRAPSPGSMPTCEAARCKTKLVVPFSCETCTGKFCASHRWATDHACSREKVAQTTASTSAGAKVGKAGGKAGKAGLAALRRAQASMATKKGSTASGSSGPAQSKSKAGPTKTNATDRSAPIGSAANPLVISDDDSKGPAKPAINASKPSASKKMANATGGVLGTKVDKRAAAERASARKALEARAKKGLLTEKEKIAYATEMALDAESKNGKKGDGCRLS